MTTKRDRRIWYALALSIGALICAPIGGFLWQNYNQDISVTVHNTTAAGDYVADIASEHDELCINSFQVLILAYGIWPTPPRVSADSFVECQTTTKSRRASVPINLSGFDPMTVRYGLVCVWIFYAPLGSDKFNGKISCE